MHVAMHSEAQDYNTKLNYFNYAVFVNYILHVLTRR